MLQQVMDVLARSDDDSGSDVPRPEAVREVIAQTEAKLDDAHDRLAELEQEHEEVLLRGDDEAVEGHEEKIQEARRDARRLEVARERLETRLEEAEESAAERRREKKLERGVELREKFAELNERYAELAAEMVPVLERMQDINREVEQLRAEVGTTGPDRELVAPGAEAFPHGNSRPWVDVVIVPAGPDAPRWNAASWERPPSRKRSTGAA